MTTLKRTALALSLAANMLVLGLWWEGRGEIRALRAERATQVIRITKLEQQLREADLLAAEWAGQAGNLERTANLVEAILEAGFREVPSDLAGLIASADYLERGFASNGTTDGGRINAVAVAVLFGRPAARASGRQVELLQVWRGDPQKATGIKVFRQGTEVFLQWEERVWMIPAAIWEAVEAAL